MAKPECCDECIQWGKFGKKCWVHWDLKKECTMHTSKWGNQPLQQDL